jgi:hypothetical protein
MKQHEPVRDGALSGLVANSSVNAARCSINKGRTSPPPPFYPTEIKKGNSEGNLKSVFTLCYDSVGTLKASFDENDKGASWGVPVIYNEDHRPQFRSRRIIPPPPSYIPRDNMYDI